MIELIKPKFGIKTDYDTKQEFKSCIIDLTQNESFNAMADFVHHYQTTRLEHSLHVSYCSFVTCRKLGLDYQSAARGGLLHDFYFYDSNVTKLKQGLHCFCHPAIALDNACQLFDLNDVEKDIILKHMWPVTIKPPKYKESYIVTLMDKYCAAREVIQFAQMANLSPLILNPSA